MHPDDAFELHEPWDVAVIGAGPAGATAAMRLAADGHSVALLDRHAFPREKTCGDALIPDALASLRRLGLLERVRERAASFRKLTVYAPNRLDVTLDGEFITLKRRVLDDLLVREAVARGARFVCAQVTGIRPGVDGVTTLELAGGDDVARGTGPRTLRARVVLIATGADTQLLAKTGMLERAAPSAFAIRCYVRSDLELDRLVVAFDRPILPGYAWIFPLPDGEYNVGCGVFGDSERARETGLRGIFETFLQTFPLARDLMRTGERVSPIRGARLRCGLTGAKPFAAPNVLAVGEAIGTTFPFTGEGIGKAMETAHIAADVVSEALRAGDPRALAAYPERVASLRPKYLGYELAERWTRSAFLSNLIARRVRRSRKLLAAASGVLNETVDPAEIFSARTLLSFAWS